jgi:hypothetical protein
VCAERHLSAVRVVGVGEVVVALRVSAEFRVVVRRCECQWRAAAPAADQFRREQLPFLLGLGMVAQEAVECRDPRLADRDRQRVRGRRSAAAQGFAAAVDRRHWSRRLRPTRQPWVEPDSRGRSIGRGIA